MAAYGTYSDQQLIVLLKQSDRDAFAEIYERYGMMIYYKVNQMLRDEESAKDLVQDLFMQVWLKPAQIKEDANLPGYLYISSRNRVYNLIEKDKTKTNYISSISKYAEEASTDTMDRLDERELMGIIALEIGKLPPKMRQVFELSRLESLSHSEIAARLNISEKTVKTQVHNALEIIKSRMKAYGSNGLIILAWLTRSH